MSSVIKKSQPKKKMLFDDVFDSTSDSNNDPPNASDNKNELSRKKVTRKIIKVNPKRDNANKINDDVSPSYPSKKQKHIEKPEKPNETTSPYFTKPKPFWECFYDIECSLNEQLSQMHLDSKVVTHIYNPIEYASDMHCSYLRKYLTGPKSLLIIGLNGGPNGMCQTGVPFGNIKTVRDLMKLQGHIKQPNKIHPGRPVTGFGCTTEEPSGARFWNLLFQLSTSLDIFAQQCFMHNFCPLTLFDEYGHNITPGELKGDDKKKLREICLKYLQQEIDLIKPTVIIAVGNYVNECMKQLLKTSPLISTEIKFYKLEHPSPRSKNNTNWPDKGRKFFEENNLIRYLKNEL